MRELAFSATPDYIVVASLVTYSQKLFFLNCATGQLFVGTNNLLVDGEMLLCVPDALLNSYGHQQNGLLLWLEEHCRRLENGIIKIREQKHQSVSRGITSLFRCCHKWGAGCIINGMTFNSCQLLSRHWVIRANDVVVGNVNGEAVIGKYPLLHPGEQEFVYESCTPLPSSSGSIEGSFMFVPGRLADPKGSQFSVLAARFPLQLPDYIF